VGKYVGGGGWVAYRRGLQPCLQSPASNKSKPIKYIILLPVIPIRNSLNVLIIRTTDYSANEKKKQHNLYAK